MRWSKHAGSTPCRRRLACRVLHASGEDRLGQLPLLTSVAVKYGIAYDAAHDIGEALLAAYGFRSVNGPGQHKALGRFLRAVLDKPPADKAANAFDRVRRVE